MIDSKSRIAIRNAGFETLGCVDTTLVIYFTRYIKADIGFALKIRKFPLVFCFEDSTFIQGLFSRRIDKVLECA